MHAKRRVRFIAVSTCVVLCVSVGGLVGSLHVAAATVDPRGVYKEVTHRLVPCCGDFTHTLTITTFDSASGQLAGSGTNSPFTFTGQLTDSHITLQTASPGSTYVSTLNGTVQSDRSMAGTFTDSLGQSGTWTATPTATLWLGNDMGGDVFETDPSGQVVADLSNLPKTGMAFDGTHLYFGDRSGNIEQRTSDGQQVLKSFSIPVSGCCAEDLAWDSKRQRLWRLDHGNTLHEIDVGPGSETQSFSLPTTDPGGILTPLGGLGVAYDPGRDLLYVSFCQQGCVLNGQGLVETVDPSTGNVIGVLFRSTVGLTAGLAYEADNDTLWVGDVAAVRNFSRSGTVISTFNRPQPGGPVDGLEFVPSVAPSAPPSITLSATAPGCVVPCSAQLAATVLGGSGSPIVGTIVTLTSVGGSVPLPIGLGVTNASGVASFVLARGSPGIDVVQAYFLNGATLVASNRVTLRFAGIALSPSYQGCIVPCLAALTFTAVDLVPGPIVITWHVVSGPLAGESGKASVDSLSNQGTFVLESCLPPVPGAQPNCPTGTNSLDASFVDSNGATLPSQSATVAFRPPPRAAVWTYIGHLSAYGPNGSAGCTATVVDSLNGSTVLTAAHCVVGFNTFVFSPDFSGNLDQCALLNPGPSNPACHIPFGTWRTTAANAHPGPAVNVSDFDHSYDFAYLVFPASYQTASGSMITGSHLEDVLGSGLQIAFPNPVSNQSWTVYGYPGGHRDSCGPANADLTSLGIGPQGFLLSNCNMFEGASGGPWINSENGITDGIGAVNSVGPTSSCGSNTCPIKGASLGDVARRIFEDVSVAPFL